MLDFYKIMNNQRTDARFNDWSRIREFNTKFITSMIEKYNPDAEKLLIIGAGNCDDIDLQMLKDKQLFYLDIDIGSVKKGIKRQNLNVCAENIIDFDLTGFEYISLYDKILQCDTFSRTKTLMIEQTSGNELKKAIHLKIESINQKFDTVIFMPVFTQLSGHVIELLSAKFPHLSTKELIYTYENIEPTVISNIKCLLDAVCKTDSLILGITDLIEITAFGQDFCNQFMQDFGNFTRRHEYIQLMAKYNQNFTLGTAVYQSILIDKNDVEKYRVCLHNLWDFDKSKMYYMFYIAKMY